MSSHEIPLDVVVPLLLRSGRLLEAVEEQVVFVVDDEVASGETATVILRPEAR